MAKLKVGINDLYTVNPELAKEWHPTKNGNLTPKDVTAGSNRKVWWILPYDDPKTGKHFDFEWEAIIGNRVKGAGCPILSSSGHIVWKGFNDLATTHPDIAREWHPTKNGELTPHDVSPGSHKLIWWYLPYDDPKTGKHFDFEWQAKVNNRTSSNTGCPYLCNPPQAIMKGFNDLATTHPHLLKEWDYEKNTILPDQVSGGTERIIYWKGHCGHNYGQMVYNHAKGIGCPVCAGKQVLEGANDLYSLFPDIASEWDYEKNLNTPSQVTAFSNKSAWWKCKLGHSYKQPIGRRTGNQKSGCPVCAKERKSSFPEQAIFFYLKNSFPDAINLDRSNGFELDIFIPSIRVAVEFDGKHWHKGKTALEKDNRKDYFCKENNIRLFRFRDSTLPSTESAEILQITENNDNSVETAIKQLLNKLGVTDLSVDLQADGAAILSQFIFKQKERSLLLVRPDIAQDWNYEKNGDLSPENVTCSSGKKVWWKCRTCGTEWYCKVLARTSDQAQGCPECTKRLIKNDKAVKVVNVDSGIIYSSVSAAAKSVNGRSGDISACCRGVQNTAFGYHWRYYDSPQPPKLKYKGKVKNETNGIVFASLQEAAKWCDGKVMNISACCKGKQKTAYGFVWSYFD